MNGQLARWRITMSGYGMAEAKMKGDRKPHVNICGGCGDPCDGLVCLECRGAFLVTSAPSVWEDESEMGRRTR